MKSTVHVLILLGLVFELSPDSSWALSFLRYLVCSSCLESVVLVPHCSIPLLRVMTRIMGDCGWKMFLVEGRREDVAMDMTACSCAVSRGKTLSR